MNTLKSRGHKVDRLAGIIPGLVLWPESAQYPFCLWTLHEARHHILKKWGKGRNRGDILREFPTLEAVRDYFMEHHTPGACVVIIRVDDDLDSVTLPSLGDCQAWGSDIGKGVLDYMGHRVWGYFALRRPQDYRPPSDADIDSAIRSSGRGEATWWASRLPKGDFIRDIIEAGLARAAAVKKEV